MFQVISKRLPQQQLTTLVFMLFEGLVDSQTNCCRASSVILNTLLKNRGAGLQELVMHTYSGAIMRHIIVHVWMHHHSCCVICTLGPRDAGGATCAPAEHHRGTG